MVKTLCGAKTSSGKPCQLEAGWGTDHPGYGSCCYHDGDDSNRPAVGRHAPLTQLVNDDSRALLQRLAEDDEEIFDLRFEIASLKKLFAQEMGREKPNAKTLSTITRTLTSSITKLREMEVGKHYYVHVNVFGLVLQAVGAVARQYLPQSDLVNFSNDLRSALKRELPASTSQNIAASALVDPIEGEMIDK